MVYVYTVKSFLILRAIAAKHQRYAEDVRSWGPKNHFKWIFS